MAGRGKVERHPKNPYLIAIQAHHAVIYAPHEYKLNQILSGLSAIAIRVLYYAMAKVDNAGQVELRPQLLGRLMQTQSSYCSVGIRELVKYNFLARQNAHTFWLNPDVARPITIQTQ